MIAFRPVLATMALVVLSAGCATSPRASSSSSPATSAVSPSVTRATTSPPVTTVILVRHAEKADASSDPELSAAGMERARLLVDVVRRANVTSIITTHFRRTRATAEPAATALGITPLVIPAQGAAHASVVADTVRARTGGVVLVVGHSNTVPAIIAALGGGTLTICDSEYDDLFVLVLHSDGRAPVLVRTRYGAESVRGVGCPAMK